MNKWFEIFTGLILLVIATIVSFSTLGIGFWDFGTAAWQVLKGGIIWFLIGIGILFVILGITDLKN